MPAIIILAFAYALNDLSATLNTAAYIISVTESWRRRYCRCWHFSSPVLWPSQPALLGYLCNQIPIAVLLAFSFSANELDTVVYATIAAVSAAYLAITARRCQHLYTGFNRSHSDHIDHVDTVALCGNYRRYLHSALSGRWHDHVNRWPLNPRLLQAGHFHYTSVITQHCP